MNWKKPNKTQVDIVYIKSEKNKRSEVLEQYSVYPILFVLS